MNTDQIIKQATTEAALRSQNTLLTQQYNAMHNTLLKYAEVMGRLVGVAKPLMAEYDTLKAEGCELPGHLDDHLDAFTKEIRGLIRMTPEERENAGTDVASENGQAQQGTPSTGAEGAPGATGEEAPPEA